MPENGRPYDSFSQEFHQSPLTPHITKEGFTFAQRKVFIQVGKETTVGKIYLIVQDSQVTEIGPGGGLHQNSTGTIEVEIPAGAVSETIPLSFNYIFLSNPC